MQSDKKASKNKLDKKISTLKEKYDASNSNLEEK